MKGFRSHHHPPSLDFSWRNGCRSCRLVGQTDLTAVLREEILAVVSWHVTIDLAQIKVDRGADASILAVAIAIPNTSLATANVWANSWPRKPGDIWGN
jgi:hypothetical protein